MALARTRASSPRRSSDFATIVTSLVNLPSQRRPAAPRRRCPAAGSGATALPRSSTGWRTRASRGGRCCRSGRPTATARPTRRARRSRRGAGCWPTRARAVSRRRARRVPRARRVLDRRLGRVRRRRAGDRRPGALRARVGARCARYAAERGVRLIGDVPIYVAPGGADHRAHPELFRDGVRRGRAARRLHRQGPAVGQPALRLAGAAAARLPLVDRAPAAHVRALRPRADRPLPRLRGLLGGAGGRARRARRALAARPRPRACSTPRSAELGRAAADRRGPRRHHAGRSSACATSSGCPGWSCCSSASTPTTRTGPHRPENHRARRRSSTPARTTTTRCAAGTSRCRASARAPRSTRARGVGDAASRGGR